MSEHVSWMFDLTVNAGKEAELQSLMAEMVAATQADEPGALDYEWHFSEDGTRLHLFERYVDSEATMVHLGNFGAKFMARFMGCVTPAGMVVYGAPSDAVRKGLAGLRPVYMERSAGFRR